MEHSNVCCSLDDYNRMVLSATRLSWEVESSWLIMDVDESDSVCLVIRQGSVNFLRRMEVFEGISLEQDDRNVSKLPASDSLYDISSIPKLFRQSNNLKLFSNSLLWNSLHWLFLQWIASLKAWKQRHDIQDTFQVGFAY